MIDRSHSLPVARQARELGISRSSVYYLPAPVSATDLGIMRRMDELHLEYPFAGSRMLRDLLRQEGMAIGRCHVANAPPAVSHQTRTCEAPSHSARGRFREAPSRRTPRVAHQQGPVRERPYSTSSYLYTIEPFLSKQYIGSPPSEWSLMTNWTQILSGNSITTGDLMEFS